MHAGGQSRRLPSYAPAGKILTPIPVFRWARGQRLSQDLLSLQIPLYEKILNAAPRRLNVMIASGDVYIRATQPLQPIPDDADIVCYGLWLGPETARNHGVFVSPRERPAELERMLQKPTVETLGNLLKDHYYLTDIGVWLLSDKAMTALAQKSKTPSGEYREYDLYGTFGCALGSRPSLPDPELADLKVAVLPLPGGEFHHFGTSRELLSSTLAIQNLVNDQREIMHHSRKPHPSIFVQNAVMEVAVTADNRNLWIENSFVGRHWTLTSENIITGVPENDWTLDLEPCQCVDIVPLGKAAWVVRPYGYYDTFAGPLQQQKLFPVVRSMADMSEVLQYMLKQNLSEHARQLYEKAEKLSAEDISAQADLRRLEAQRRHFRAQAWPLLASNHEHSVFYQLDLEDAAQEFAQFQVPMPERLPAAAPLMTRIHDAMFRGEADLAFGLLREGLTRRALEVKQTPHMNVYADQIVWGRSPVRIDLAGGWTDTPPYCLMEGGHVVNLAIELNGQPPLQTYVKPCRERKIILRSIDLGSAEEITTYAQLADFKNPQGCTGIGRLPTRFLFDGLSRPCRSIGGFRLRYRVDHALGDTCRQRFGHEFHPCRHGAGCPQRLLRLVVGQERDRPSHARAGATAHDGWWMAGSVWRFVAGNQVAADRQRIPTRAFGEVSAGGNVHRSGAYPLSLALLYRHHSYRQGHLEPDSPQDVSQPA